MNIVYAKNPRHNLAGGVCLTVKFDKLDSEVPFTASPTDTEAYGRDLYQRAMLGEFGPVAVVKRDSSLDTAVFKGKVRSLLSESDIIVLRHYEAGERVPIEWISYRQQLRDLLSASVDVELLEIPKMPKKINLASIGQ